MVAMRSCLRNAILITWSRSLRSRSFADRRGQRCRSAFRNSLDLARHLNALGYRRHWMVKNHNLVRHSERGDRVGAGPCGGRNEQNPGRLRRRLSCLGSPPRCACRSTTRRSHRARRGGADPPCRCDHVVCLRRRPVRRRRSADRGAGGRMHQGDAATVLL